MTRPVTWPGVGVQTAGQLQRKHRSLDRRRQAAAVVLTAMQRGQSLQLVQTGSAPVAIVRRRPGQRRDRQAGSRRPRVVDVGDALFEGMPGQTWRWSDGVWGTRPRVRAQAASAAR
jgi:hypothetical protein